MTGLRRAMLPIPNPIIVRSRSSPNLNLAGEAMGVGGSEQDDFLFDGRRRRLFQWNDVWINDDQQWMDNGFGWDGPTMQVNGIQLIFKWERIDY